jgi:hypothetical protein
MDKEGIEKRLQRLESVTWTYSQGLGGTEKLCCGSWHCRRQRTRPARTYAQTPGGPEESGKKVEESCEGCRGHRKRSFLPRSVVGIPIGRRCNARHAQIWSHWKQQELPNFCPQTFGDLSYQARRALRRMRRRPTLVMAFWERAEHFPL